MKLNQPANVQARCSIRLLVALICAGAQCTTARAEDAPKDKAGYSLFNPTPDEKLRSFSTDRPTKSNVAYTVDAGRFQYEMDLINAYYRRVGSTSTHSITGPNPWLKVGITNSIDFEINTPAPQTIEVRDTMSNLSTKASGFNDMFLRAKINLWGNDGGKSAFAIIPNLKIPTAATGLGNGAVEGGVISALSFNLPGGTTLLFNSEIDSFKNLNGSGYHANAIGLVNLSREVAKDVTGYVEFWVNDNYDPVRTIHQKSIDTALAWAVRKDTQIDIGANFGLTHDTPVRQFYLGVAQRF